MDKTHIGMTSWLNWTVIALGGAAGSLCRYGITLAAAAVPGGTTMVGTTIANLLGCAAIGGLASLCEIDGMISERTALALRVGFLGSLTTFSTFAAESTMLAGEGRWGASTVYVLSNLILGWLVLLIANSLVRGWVG